MSSQGGWGKPGTGSIAQTNETEILWGGDESKGLVLFLGSTYSGAMRDAGNTPTTLLRAGLLLGTVTADAEDQQWDSAATDGSADFSGILPNELRAQDYDGNDADRFFRKLVRGPVRAAALLIKGSALVGHADEFLARRSLHLAGFILDDDVFGYKTGLVRRTVNKAASYQVLTSENGMTFTMTLVSTFTLPAIKAGLRYTFLSLVNAAMTIASSEGDNIIIENDISADSVAFSTASKMLGAQVTLAAEYCNGTLKWIKQSEPGFTETTAT